MRHCCCMLKVTEANSPNLPMAPSLKKADCYRTQIAVYGTRVDSANAVMALCNMLY